MSTKAAAIQVAKTTKLCLKSQCTPTMTTSNLQSTVARRNVTTSTKKRYGPVIVQSTTTSSANQGSKLKGVASASAAATNVSKSKTRIIRRCINVDWKRHNASSAAAMIPHHEDQQQQNQKPLEKDLAATTKANKTSAIQQALNRGTTAPLDPIEDILYEVDMDKLHALANSKLTPLSLLDMYKYGCGTDMKQRLLNAQFLHTELPKRIAQRTVELLSLPYGLRKEEQILEVTRIYLRYLKEFENCPLPTTMEKEHHFTEVLRKMVLDRKSIPTMIARGVEQWFETRKYKEALEIDRLQQMENALYRFFTARVGLRFLTEHHVLSSPKRCDYFSLRTAQSLVFDKNTSKPSDMGCIQTNCDLKKEVTQVADEIRRQTKAYYGYCPDIEIVQCNGSETGNFTYVPHHLQYMVAELLKNSCRATIQHHKGQVSYDDTDDPDDIGSKLPAVQVVIAKGAQDVTIKIADLGGGIPRSKLGQVWKFANSTAHEETEGNEKIDFNTDVVTGGNIRGYGLPLARIYARYFGGELTLRTMEGYGVDAYLHLKRLGDACENLPPSVSISPGELTSTVSGSKGFMGNYYDREYDSVVVNDDVFCDSLDDTLENAKLLRVMSILRKRAL